MKRYKIIKEYPFSPKLGFETYYNSEFLPEKYPEYWEEVIEKEYEILSFDWKGNLVTYRKNKDRYIIEHANDNDFPGNTLEEELTHVKSGHCRVHSVKRLSDGEIFTIGDTVHFEINKKTSPSTSYKIKEFRITQNGIFTKFERGDTQYLFLDLNWNLKKPLFKTEDGVNIYKNDKFVAIQTTSENFNIFNCTTGSQIVTKKIPGWKYFSTKEKAEEYIIMNKPCLSIKDIEENGLIRSRIRKERLIKVVKNKLNK